LLEAIFLTLPLVCTAHSCTSPSSNLLYRPSENRDAGVATLAEVFSGVLTSEKVRRYMGGGGPN